MEMRALSSVFCRGSSSAESVEAAKAERHALSRGHRAPPGCASQDDEGLVLDPEARYIWAERQTLHVQTPPQVAQESDFSDFTAQKGRFLS